MSEHLWSMTQRTSAMVLIVVLVLAGTLGFLPGVSHAEDSSTDTTAASMSGLNESTTKEFVSEWGVEYSMTLEKPNGLAHVSIHNPKDRAERTRFGILVDDDEAYWVDQKLEPGETFEKTFHITSYLDPTRDNHSISASGPGEYVVFQYRQQIDSLSPDEVSKPTVSDISVTTTEDINGNRVSALAFTVTNPTIHVYSLEAMVHTSSATRRTGVAVRSDNSKRFVVPLQEDPGEFVEGELRFYAGSVNSTDDAFAQYSFSGRAGGATNVSEETYTPVAPPWAEEPYRYGSPDRTGPASQVEDVVPTENPVGIVGGVVALSALVVALVAWRVLT